jgi:hypothetical protein
MAWSLNKHGTTLPSPFPNCRHSLFVLFYFISFSFAYFYFILIWLFYFTLFYSSFHYILQLLYILPLTSLSLSSRKAPFKGHSLHGFRSFTLSLSKWLPSPHGLPCSPEKRGSRIFWTVGILVPAIEHGYFVANWWRTPLRHPPSPKFTRFNFQQTSGIDEPVGKRKCCFLFGSSLAPIADSFHVATMTRKHSVLNLQEIKRNNGHTALASVLTYYGRVTLIF